MDLSSVFPVSRSAAFLALSGAILFAPALAQAETPDATSPPASSDAAPAPSTSDSAATTSSATPSATTLSDIPASPSKQRPRGFALHLNFGGRLLVANPDINTPIGTTSIQGGLFAGYKIDRVVFGLGFDIGYISTGTHFVSAGNESTGNRGDTSFLLGPGVQVAILRSNDQRIEMTGTFNIMFGTTVTTQSQDPEIPPNYGPETQTSNFHLAYQIAPGLRYWAHPQFALTLTSGVAADHYFYSQNNPSGLRSDQVNTVSLFGAIGALGVF